MHDGTTENIRCSISYYNQRLTEPNKTLFYHLDSLRTKGRKLVGTRSSSRVCRGRRSAGGFRPLGWASLLLSRLLNLHYLCALFLCQANSYWFGIPADGGKWGVKRQLFIINLWVARSSNSWCSRPGNLNTFVLWNSRHVHNEQLRVFARDPAPLESKAG